MKTEKLHDRVASLGRTGIFGDGPFLRVTSNEDVATAPQFASQLSFYVVELKQDSKTAKVPIVCKIQPKTDKERESHDADNQFSVEVRMYKEILPLLSANDMDIFPKFIYGEASEGRDPDSDLVILEDLTEQGFKTIDNLYLDPETIKLCLRSLGRFHGLSYRVKKTRFDELKSSEKRLSMKKFSPEFNAMIEPCIERGFKAAKTKNCGDSVELLDEALRKIKHYTATGLWEAMSLPKEPFAVVVHGDFNRNNLMFKYCDGEPKNVRFLDFQRSLYADPSIDIAFLLYMNTSQETRNTHWDDFFEVYWEGLTSIEPSPGFTYEEFRDNFAVMAVYGYLPCSFFLPMMMETERPAFEDYVTWDLERRISRKVNAGGAEGERVISNIVQDLLDRGFLKRFLVSFQ